MLLSDQDIRCFIEGDDIKITPYDPTMIQPSSVDVHLSNTFRIFDTHTVFVIDPSENQLDDGRLIILQNDDSYILHPGDFVLGSTLESVQLSRWVAGRMEGKSSLGRVGLLTHSTAGFIDPGFVGTITLELSNVSKLPIRLRPGMAIGQLCFFLLSSAAEKPYGHPDLRSHYQNQVGPTSAFSVFVMGKE